MTITTFINELNKIEGLTTADRFEAFRRVIDSTEIVMSDEIESGNISFVNAIYNGFDVVLDNIKDDIYM